MSDEQNTVEEPSSSYGQGRISFFQSFEEAEWHSLATMASHTPLQRLQNLAKLRRRLGGATPEELPLEVRIIKGDFL